MTTTFASRAFLAKGVLLLPILAILYDYLGHFIARQRFLAHCEEPYLKINNYKEWTIFQHLRKIDAPSMRYSVKINRKFPKRFFDLPYATIEYRLKKDEMEIASLWFYTLYKHGSMRGFDPMMNPIAKTCPSIYSIEIANLLQTFSNDSRERQ